MNVHVPLLPPCLYLYFIPHFNILAFNTFYRRSRSPNQNPIPVSSSTSSTIDIAMDVPRRSQRYSRYLCSHRSPTSIDDRIEHAWPSNNYRPKKEAVVDRPRPDGQKKTRKTGRSWTDDPRKEQTFVVACGRTVFRPITKQSMVLVVLVIAWTNAPSAEYRYYYCASVLSSRGARPRARRVFSPSRRTGANSRCKDAIVMWIDNDQRHGWVFQLIARTTLFIHLPTPIPKRELKRHD